MLKELDQLCFQITNEGRIIPWNGLKVNFSPCSLLNAEDPTFGNEINIITFESQHRPKFLEFHWKFPWWGADCPVHKPLEAILRQCTSELRIFQISNLPPGFSHVLSDWVPKFPKLEVVIISNLPESDLRCDERSELKEIVRCIVKAAPKLQKIIAKDTESLEMIPEDKYGLLDQLKFHFRSIQDEDLHAKVADGRPALRKLHVFQPFPVQVHEDVPANSVSEHSRNHWRSYCKRAIRRWRSFPLNVFIPCHSYHFRRCQI